MATYTARQLTVLKWISWPSAILSVSGSSCIIYHIVKSRSYFSSTRSRLLLGVCVFDIVLSLAVSVGGVLVEAIEGRAVCQTQGFFAQLGSAVSYYTGALNLYFLLLIRNNVTEQKMSTVYEPLFHLVAFVYPLATALVCIPLDLYNGVVQGCHIHAYPFGCDQTDAYECERGANAAKFFWAFSGGPHLAILVLIAASQTMLYLSVRSQLRTTLKYDTTGVLRNEGQKKQLMEVAAQSLSYVLAYVIALLPALVISYIQAFDYDRFVPSRFFPLLCILFLTYPLQGALNFLVFIRPKYLQLRRAESKSRWRAFWEAATVVDMTTLQEPRRRKTIPMRSAKGSSLVRTSYLGASNQTSATAPPAAEVTAREDDAAI